MALLLCSLERYKANAPGKVETELAGGLKEFTIGGKDWHNPTPDTRKGSRQALNTFRHHCQVCHGLDGHNSGVPFAANMSPPVADLGSPEIQGYTDGQLKWIIQNGVRFTGMPSWKGVLKDDVMWLMVRYIRHLSLAGSLGKPSVYAEFHEHSKGSTADNLGNTIPHEH